MIAGHDRWHAGVDGWNSDGGGDGSLGCIMARMALKFSGLVCIQLDLIGVPAAHPRDFSALFPFPTLPPFPAFPVKGLHLEQMGSDQCSCLALLALAVDTCMLCKSNRTVNPKLVAASSPQIRIISLHPCT